MKLLSEGCCGIKVQCLDIDDWVSRFKNIKNNERARKTANNFLLIETLPIRGRLELGTALI